MTEQQWIARARHGDADAFEQLVVAYEGPVYRLALRMCGSAEDAREVAQDAFLAAWRGLPAFRGDSRFSSWLYRLTTNAAIDFLRRESTIWETSRWRRPRSGRIPSSRSFWRSRESSRRPCKGRWISCHRNTGRCCCCGWCSK